MLSFSSNVLTESYVFLSAFWTFIVRHKLISIFLRCKHLNIAHAIRNVVGKLLRDINSALYHKKYY